MSDDPDSFTLQIDGGPGDLHCMTCLKICNFNSEAYCCAKIQNMPPQKKRSESAFLMVCLHRHAIDEMVKALIADKQIVDKKGNCVFCRNKKQHEEEKWCAGKTKLELYLHQISKEEVKVEIALEKYLEIRIQNRMNELKRVQERIVREMREVAQSQGKDESEIKHMLTKQGREARKMQRRENDHIEEENKGIRGRLAAKVTSKKAETIKKLEDAARPPLPKLFQESRRANLRNYTLM